MSWMIRFMTFITNFLLHSSNSAFWSFGNINRHLAVRDKTPQDHRYERNSTIKKQANEFQNPKRMKQVPKSSSFLRFLNAPAPSVRPNSTHAAALIFFMPVQSWDKRNGDHLQKSRIEYALLSADLNLMRTLWSTKITIVSTSDNIDGRSTGNPHFAAIFHPSTREANWQLLMQWWSHYDVLRDNRCRRTYSDNWERTNIMSVIISKTPNGRISTSLRIATTQESLPD
jgi:hypothetical protein